MKKWMYVVAMSGVLGMAHYSSMKAAQQIFVDEDEKLQAHEEWVGSGWLDSKKKVIARFLSPANGRKVAVVALSADNKFAAIGFHDNVLRVVNIATGAIQIEQDLSKLLGFKESLALYGLKFSLKSHVLAIRFTNGSGVLLNVDTGEHTVQPEMPQEKIDTPNQLPAEGSPLFLAKSRQGNLVAIAFDNGQAGVWSVVPKEPIAPQKPLTLDERLRAYRESIPLEDKKNEQELVLAYLDSIMEENRRSVAEYRKNKEKPEKPEEPIALLRGHEGMVYAIAISGDNAFAVTAGEDKTARVWNLSTKECVHVLPHDGEVFAIDISFDGKYIITGTSKGSVYLWSLEDAKKPKSAYAWLARNSQVLKQELTADLNNRVKALAFSPSGMLAAIGFYDGALRVVNVATNKILFQHDDLTGPLSLDGIAFSPNNNVLHLRSLNGKEGLLDIVTGHYTEPVGLREQRPTATAAIWQDALSKGNVISSAVSRDGAFFVAGYSDNVARVWSVATGEQVAYLDGHTGPVYAVAISADNNFVVTGSADNLAFVWDLSTGESTHRLKHSGEVFAVSISPDGARIMTGTSNGIVYLWTVK